MHISQLSDERVENVTDVVSEGQMVKVKVLEVDKQGRIRLSMKAVYSRRLTCFQGLKKTAPCVSTAPFFYDRTSTSSLTDSHTEGPACPGASLQRQLFRVLPGVFRRASDPRPR